MCAVVKFELSPFNIYVFAFYIIKATPYGKGSSNGFEAESFFATK